MSRTLSAPDWQAMRFEQVMASGRTKPLLLECVHRHTHERRLLVVKAIGLPEVESFSLAHEWFGCRLARALGLDAPQAELVDLTPEFLEAVRADLADGGVRPRPGTAVGTHYLRGFNPFSSLPALREDELGPAGRIFTFDLLVQNPDRRPDKPNCGRAGGRVVPIDFEMAFSFRLAIVREEPWRVSGLPFARKHLFSAELAQNLWALDEVFGPLRQGVFALSSLWRDAPGEWSTIGDSIRAHVEAVLGRWADFEAQVKLSLGSVRP